VAGCWTSGGVAPAEPGAAGLGAAAVGTAATGAAAGSTCSAGAVDELVLCPAVEPPEFGEAAFCVALLFDTPPLGALSVDVSTA
jgi:hypothetical protein